MNEYKCEHCVEVYYFGLACHYPKIYNGYALRQYCVEIREKGECPLKINKDMKVESTEVWKG